MNTAPKIIIQAKQCASGCRRNTLASNGYTAFAIHT